MCLEGATTLEKVFEVMLLGCSDCLGFWVSSFGPRVCYGSWFISSRLVLLGLQLLLVSLGMVVSFQASKVTWTGMLN